jgi:zinc/manganese transport system substrate-binding protein
VSVVASTPIVADWVRAVGGDDVRVDMIIPAGVDPHDADPTAEAARAVAGAAVVFSSGAGLDEWADKIVEAAGGGAPLVELAPEKRLIALREDDEHDEPGHDDAHGDDAGSPAEDDAHAHGDVDPHYWHDPTLVSEAVATIAATLAEADPSRADAYAKRAAEYQSLLTDLDRELTAAVATVPEGQRSMVTDHDAFAYLGQRYGIDIVGAAIPATSGAASADARTLAGRIKVIKDRGVPAVFSESTADPSVARVLADEAGVRLVDGLYADTLAPADDAAGTYIGMMQANMRLIIDGLRG